jgi:hypothetical protein
MEELLTYLARELVADPEAVSVRASGDDDVVVLELSVAAADLGRVIGRGGRTARALRTVLRAAGTRDGRRVSLEINGA